MIQRARSFFRNSELGVSITVGVVGGLALYYALTAFVTTFIIPPWTHEFGRRGAGAVLIDAEGPKAMLFTWGGVDFNYQTLFVNGIALGLIAFVAYVLFLVPSGEPANDDSGTRECPECKTEIWADARRCPHCTSAVEPVTQPSA
jgi:large conductance mechanosensitive channel